MPLTTSDVLSALRRVKGPGLKDDIVSLGLVSEVLIDKGVVSFAITVPPERARDLEPLRLAAEKVVGEVKGVASVTAVLTAERAASPARSPASAPAPAAAPARGVSGDLRIKGVRYLIAVASGKGGVGKSTSATNLALGLKALGLKVGILDADIYGPSQPRLLGLTGPDFKRPERIDKPFAAYGLKAMSIGFLIDEATPIVWRAPMVTGALNDMLRKVDWGELDVLVIDMPPGTGDIHLSIAQAAPLSGAVIVSTPQDLALIDARKGISMFERVNIPVLGIIENMSYFVCPKCGERSDIFGHGGAEHEAERQDVPFLGAVPLDMAIRKTSDAGTPIVASEPGGPYAKAYLEIARKVWAGVQMAEAQKGVKPPELELSSGQVTLTARFGDASYDLPAEYLRVMSPSAEVQGHSPDQRVTVAGKRLVKIRDLRPVGTYAVRIAFDDGHDTGLYSWSYLNELGRNRERLWNGYLAELKAKGLSRD